MTRWWIEDMRRKVSYQVVVGTDAEHTQDFWQGHRMFTDQCIDCGHAHAENPMDPCPGCGVDWLGEGTYIEPGFSWQFRQEAGLSEDADVTEPMPTYDGQPVRPIREDDDTKWLALLIRQGLKVIVVGIEKRYGLEDWRKDSNRRIA